MSYYLFPFDKVPKNSRIVLYGAGNVGKQFYDQVTKTNFCKIMLWLDKNANEILVKKPEKIVDLNVDDYDIVVIAIESETIMLEVKALLINYGVPESKILHKVHLITKDSPYSNFDNLRKNILYDFQCKTDLDPAKINMLFQAARQKNLHFSAQAAQDIIAYLFFKGKTNGFYIDIGANDGISGSTTFWAEQAGWKGICVEPQKSTFEKMKKVRKCSLYNYAVSNKSQENVEFIQFPDINFRSGLAGTMTENHIIEAKQFSNMEKDFVSTKTFGDIMADFKNVNFIDFLSIDTEGHEMQVLESIDFTKFKFGLITIETQDGSDVVKYIENNGYKKLMVAYSDVLFVPNNVQAKNPQQYLKEQPLVSVICFAYNHEKFIQKCLDGFVMQKNNFAFQVIIHDDASTDKTADIIREYQEKYPEIIKPIFQSENQYSKEFYGNMIEKIYSNLRGKYTAFCEGDDYWTDEYKLQKQVDFLESHPEFVMCSGGYCINDTIDDKLDRPQIIFSENPIGFVYNFEIVLKKWCVKTLTTMYRTNIVLDFYKSFIKSFKFSRDVHLVYLALQQGQGYYFSQQLGIANIHVGGIFNGLNNFEKNKINQKVLKELWKYTKDNIFLESCCGLTIFMLENFWQLSIEERKELLDDTKELNLQPSEDLLEQISQSIVNRYIKQPRKTLRFEVHLTDHCNLNCKHCGHFCPVAEKKFTDIAILDRDFKRLSYLTGRQNEIVDLMGGEPLLHPKINEIMIIARKHFDGLIRVVTNGILLPNMPDSFWQTAHDNNIVVEISVYPIKIDLEKIARNSAIFGVSINNRSKINENEWFRGHYDIEGKQNLEQSYLKCVYGNSCWYLEDGKLSRCGAPLLIKHLNKHLDKNFEAGQEDYIDIFKVNSFREIAENFAKVIPYCRYCIPKFEYVQWEQSKKDVSEWL